MTDPDRDRQRDEVLARIDLAEMIRAEGIELRRDGRDLRGLCPFHDDRSPSLAVYERDGRQRFKCYGCDARGDAIDWHQRRTGKTYPEALDELAGPSGAAAAPLPPKRKAPPKRPPEEFATEREAANAIRKRLRPPGAAETAYPYRGEGGELLGGMLRFDPADGSRKVLRYLWRTPSGRWRIEGFDELPPRPLYRLPQLLAADPAEPVFVFEGEKCAEAGASCGLLATSAPHGGKAALCADWSPIAGRAVVVVPDRDETGETHRRDVREAAMAAGAASVRVVELWRRWPELPKAGGDIADLVKGLGPEELANLGQAVRQLAKTPTAGELLKAPPPVEAPPSEPSEALPVAELLDLPAAFRPFPVDALPEPMRSAVREKAQAVGCDPSAIALPMLSATAAAIGNSLQAEVSPEWREPAIVWTAVVCDPGDRKTQAMRQALAAIRRHEAQLRAEHANAKAAYEEAAAEHAKRERAKRERPGRKRAKGADRPEELGEELAEELSEPKPPPPGERIIATDATIKALAELLARNPRGLLLVQNELGQWFADFNRHAPGGKGGDAFAWAECFDAEAWTIDRAVASSVFVPRVSVSVAGSIQPGSLRRALADGGGQHRDNGLAARFNIAVPPRRRPAGVFELRTVRPETNERLGRMFDALLALPVTKCHLGHPSPQAVRFSASGMAALKRWHPRIEAEMAQREGHLRAVWSKLGGGLVRYALVLCAARWASASARGAPMRAEMEAEDVEAAAQLVLWFGHEWDRFEETLESEADDAGGAPRRPTAEETSQRERTKLLRHAMACGGEMTPRQLANRDRRYRPVSVALAALRQAEGDGLGRLVTRENSGAPASLVFVMALHDRPSGAAAPPKPSETTEAPAPPNATSEAPALWSR